MDSALTPNRSALGGTAVLMACACGAASNSAALIAAAGLGATGVVLHPIFIGVAAILIVYGLWKTSTRSAYLALAAFGVLAIAAAITPPSVMTMGGDEMSHAAGLPWNGLQMVGASLYLVSAGILGSAFWLAFPSRNPGASATAIGGMALATGCTACCMVTGAIAGMAVTAGASVAFERVPFIFFAGLAAVAAGLYRLGGARAAILAPLGGLIAWGGPKLLELTGNWMVAGANLRSLVSYVPRLAGVAVILYGFVLAYQRLGVGDVADARGRRRSSVKLGRVPEAASGD